LGFGLDWSSPRRKEGRVYISRGNGFGIGIGWTANFGRGIKRRRGGQWPQGKSPFFKENWQKTEEKIMYKVRNTYN
jgi:hypothetical protein